MGRVRRHAWMIQSRAHAITGSPLYAGAAAAALRLGQRRRVGPRAGETCREFPTPSPQDMMGTAVPSFGIPQRLQYADGSGPAGLHDRKTAQPEDEVI